MSQNWCDVGHAGAPSLAARKAIVSECTNDADRAGGLFCADSCSAGSLCELGDQMVIGRCSLSGAGGVFYRAGDFDFAGTRGLWAANLAHPIQGVSGRYWRLFPLDELQVLPSGSFYYQTWVIFFLEDGVAAGRASCSPVRLLLVAPP